MKFRLGTICHTGNGRLGYVYLTGGERSRRLRSPYRIERWIVAAWNRTVCAIVGHDLILETVWEAWDDRGRYACPACCARLTPRISAVRQRALTIESERKVVRPSDSR